MDRLDEVDCGGGGAILSQRKDDIEQQECFQFIGLLWEFLVRAFAPSSSMNPAEALE